MPPTPFPGADLQSTAVTPHRKTHVRFNTPEYRILKKHEGGAVPGARISNPAGLATPNNLSNAPNPGQNHYVTFLPSGHWIISSWEMMMQFERLECVGTIIVPDDFPAGPQTELAPGWKVFASQSTIPGVSYDPSVIPLGSYWARNRVAAGGPGWGQELTADLSPSTGVAQPMNATNNAPLLRVAHQLGTNPPNAGVYLRFQGPGGPLDTQDALITFYFGGQVATSYPDGGTDPSTHPSGGYYCLTLYGDGHAQLYESTYPSVSSPWRPVLRFNWIERGHIANRTHVVIVVPEFTDTLNFLIGDVHVLYRSTPNTAVYSAKAAMTGAGQLRLDMRADLRLPFQFGTFSFPPSGDPAAAGAKGGGTIYGSPFQSKFRLPTAVVIRVTPDVLAPAGTALKVALYDGKTHAALTANPDGTFSTITAGQRYFYPVFQLFGSTDHIRSPFLRAYTWSIDGVTQLRTPTPFEADYVMDLTINGPDLDIDCDSASVLIEDPLNVLSQGPTGPSGPEGGLDNHAGFRCEITTQYDKDDPTKETRIFDGVLVQASGLRVGKDWGRPDQYPARAWKTYRCHMAGMWQRLSEPSQINWQAADFMRDPSGATDTDGTPLPWKVKDIITHCLLTAGFPSAQVQINGPETRLWGNAKNTEDYYILPGKPLGEFISHMAKYYLGGRVLWDEVAQRWIAVYPPPFSGTYTPVWTFTTDVPAHPPTDPPFPIHVPGVYPAATTFVENYSKWMQEPEGNYFAVATMYIPGRGPNEIDEQAMKSSHLEWVFGVNWRSADFDGYPASIPSHIDYIPRGIKPVITVDPTLYRADPVKTREALTYVCRRQMDAGAYGLRWYQWRAPLVLYFDPDTAYAGKPRKLRTYDVVKFLEDGTAHNVLLTCCNPHISLDEGGDLHQVADYEGYEIPVPLSY